MKIKLERFLFHLFLFSIPFQARFILVQWTAGFNEWTAAFLWGTDILFALLIILNFKLLILNKKYFILIVFLAIALISITQAIIPAIAWYRWVKLFEYALVFLYLQQAMPVLSTPRLFALVIVGSGVFQALLGILQIIFQHSMGLGIFGESVLDPMGQGVAVVVADSHMFLRAYGTMPHPNLLAVWLLLALWAFVWWYLSSNRSRLWLLVGAVLLFGFFATFSRVAILCGGIVSLVTLVLVWRRQCRDLLFAGVLTSLLFLSLFWPQVHSRLSLSVQDEAVSQRIFYADVVRDTASQTFWLGSGIGQFVPRLMKQLPHYPHYIYQPAHNIYLLIYHEIGFFGAFAFIIFIFAVIKNKNRYSIILTLGLLSLGLFDHYFWTLQQGGLMLWGFLAVVAVPEFWYDKA